VDDVLVELDAPPQATKDPVSMTATTTSHNPADRLRRKMNGSPRKSAQNVAAPPLFHGDGMRFSASAFVVIVTVALAVAPALSVTGFALADTFAAVPSLEVTLLVKETVPAKLLEVRTSVADPMLPGAMESADVFAESV
jgi:hypothetical protein